MIRKQRIRHRWIWLLWSFLLPAGIILAWLAIPNGQSVRLLKPTTSLLPQVYRSAGRPDFQVLLRTNVERTKWQIEWQNKTIMAVPSAVIYRIIDAGREIAHQQLVGRIETRGSYLFDLVGDSTGFDQMKLVLYDFIHEQRIDSINL